MKRIFTLALGLMACATSLFAQETTETTEKTTDLKFVIIDEQKNEVREIADGEQLIADNYDDLTNAVLSNLAIKNVSANGKRAQLKFVISEMENGNFSSCFGGSCIRETKVGEYFRPLLIDSEWIQNLPVIKAGEFEDIETEWIPQGNGKCVVKFTANVGTVDEDLSDSKNIYYATTEGPSVTITFLNGITGIKNVDATKADNAYYDLMGRKIAQPQKGIYIKNGKKIVK